VVEEIPRKTAEGFSRLCVRRREEEEEEEED
jgi:hypothetical protein